MFHIKSTSYKKYFLIPVVRVADNLYTLSSLTFIFTESNYKKENHLEQLVKVISNAQLFSNARWQRILLSMF